MGALRKWLGRSDDGVTSIEYALLGSLIAVVIAASVALIGVNLQPAFKTIADAL